MEFGWSLHDRLVGSGKPLIWPGPSTVTTGMTLRLVSATMIVQMSG
jgi:hypothetical protein